MEEGGGAESSTIDWKALWDSSIGDIASGDTSKWGNIIDQLVSAGSTPAGAIAGLAGLYQMFGNRGGSQIAGYGGSIPDLTAQYAMPAGQTEAFMAPPPREYGAAAMGHRYLPDITYAPKGTAAAPAPSPAPAPAPSPAPAPAPAPGTGEGEANDGVHYGQAGAAHGGLMGLASGRYLKGSTDGMADEIPSSIDGKQPAKLSHGEFVVPADVVSHLGNGNSDAGADVLYKMMDRVRRARTGNPHQGKRINPEKFTPGGIASYDGGGAIAFDGGGATAGTNTTGATTATTTGANTTSTNPTSTTSNLSAWIGPYVTNMLGRAQALGNMGYTPYTGQLTAGTSPLQQKAYKGLTEFQNQSFTKPDVASAYMSPYMQNVVDVQQQQAQRQADIANQAAKAQFAQSGAFGGGRAGIYQGQAAAELARQKQAIQAQGLQSAFNQAQSQYNTERQMGLQGLGALLGAGTQQQQTEQQALDAQRAQFEQQRMFPYQQLQFMQSFLQGLPVGTQTTSAQLNPLQQTAGNMAGIQAVYDAIKNLPGFGG